MRLRLRSLAAALGKIECQKGISPELRATWLSRGKKKVQFLGIFCLFSCVLGQKKGRKKTRAQPWYARKSGKSPGQEWGVFGRGGGFSNSRFVLKPDVAIASEVSISSKNSLAITDFHAKKTQHVQLFENPLPGTPPIRDSQSAAGFIARSLCSFGVTL